MKISNWFKTNHSTDNKIKWSAPQEKSENEHDTTNTYEEMDLKNEGNIEENEVQSDKEIVSINPRDFFWQNDGTDPKWMNKCINIWYGAMCFIWFIIGTISYAPVIFISKKLEPMVKDKRKSLLIAIGLYAIIFVIVCLLLFAKPSPPVQSSI